MAVVLEIGGMKLDANINKAGLEEACNKLGRSGIFETVGYHYEPGPKHGYVVTLELADPRKMVDRRSTSQGRMKMPYGLGLRRNF